MTGENKKKFNIWFNRNYLTRYVITFHSDSCPFEMQIGVYLAYYDSLEWGGVVSVDWRSAFNGDYTFSITSRFHGGVSVCNPNYKCMMETYKEAFKKANEILNKQLK